jgi:hypothetical protein
MPITKAGTVVNIFFRRLNGRFRQIRAKPLALNFISYGSKIVDPVVWEKRVGSQQVVDNLEKEAKMKSIFGLCGDILGIKWAT